MSNLAHMFYDYDLAFLIFATLELQSVCSPHISGYSLLPRAHTPLHMWHNTKEMHVKTAINARLK